MTWSSAASGSYGYIGMSDEASYTDAKASSTEWNFYWVFAYHTEGGKMIAGAPAPYVYGRAR